jgi:AraC-like DNA-binding protein
MASVKRRRHVLFIESGAAASTLISRLSGDVVAAVVRTARQRLALLSSPRPPGVELVIIVCASGVHRRKVPSGITLLSTIRQRWPGMPAVAVLVAGGSVLLLEPCGSTSGDYLDKARAASVLDLGRARRRHPARGRRRRPMRRDDRFERVIALVNERYTGPLSLADVAQLAQVTPGYLRGPFRLALGMPLRDYVRELRLERARRLIATTSAALTDVALEAGFYDLPHFDKTFRKRYGISPHEFRLRKSLARAGDGPKPAPESASARSG